MVKTKDKKSLKDLGRVPINLEKISFLRSLWDATYDKNLLFQVIEQF